MRLLIADDSLSIRERLFRRLCDLPGLSALDMACDGDEALELFAHSNPDLVVLDIELPGKNGIRVLEEIKRVSPSTCVLMFTNFPYPQYRKKCLELGAEQFFDKFYEFDNVIHACKEKAERLRGVTSATFPGAMHFGVVNMLQYAG